MASTFVRIKEGTEGINLGEKGQMTQIEIGLTNGEAYILDLVTCPNLVVAGGHQRLLELKMVLKRHGANFIPEAATFIESAKYWVTEGND
ncbi:hypothetical protein O3M35_003966 [Rhynocoris fuscipes]|uniref:Uncharacterized protein n=1 Tax=Rhynocoris fuscipes TaxID=488301 RepID=A0AAW1CPA3_9HEMI